MKEEYLDKKRKPLDTECHYKSQMSHYQGYIPDTGDEIIYFFTADKKLVDIDGNIIPFETAKKLSLVKLRSLEDYLNILDKQASKIQKKANFIRKNLGSDLVSKYLTNEDELGVDGS